MGSKIFRLGVYDNDNLLACALVIKKESPHSSRKAFGRHLFIPHGPSILEKYKHKYKTVLLTLLKECQKIGKWEGANFLRVNPICPRETQYQKIFWSLGFIDSPVFVHPEVTWLLDITKDNDVLLSEMRKTTRYMIKQADKYGVQIYQGNSLNDISEYNKIYIETVKRQHFEPFSLEYLQNEYKAFTDDNQILTIFSGENNQKEVGAMIIFWQGQAFYHQGASNIKNHKAGSSYALQWAIINEAKKRGCKIYNFWGIEEDIKTESDINSDQAKKHPWWGLSLFKIGFGGKRVDYLKTKDYPFTLMYWPFALYERLRRLKKRI
jgi:lipid II:glycine glycyltransferase (peptidoglycan interpeptide bridge formation enzyme)